MNKFSYLKTPVGALASSAICMILLYTLGGHESNAPKHDGIMGGMFSGMGMPLELLHSISPDYALKFYPNMGSIYHLSEFLALTIMFLIAFCFARVMDESEKIRDENYQKIAEYDRLKREGKI